MTTQTIPEFAYETYVRRVKHIPADEGVPTLDYYDIVALMDDDALKRGDLLGDFLVVELQEQVKNRSADNVDGLEQAIALIQRARDDLWAVEQALYARREALATQKPSGRPI